MNTSTNKLLFLWILIFNSSVFAAEKLPTFGLAVVIMLVLSLLVVFILRFLVDDSGAKAKREQLEISASKGDAKALYDLGMLIYNSGSYMEGIKHLLKAAELKYVPGLNQARKLIKQTEPKKPIIDFCKEKGNSFFQNKEYDKAVVYYEGAYVAGDATATYNLGVCYYNGYGVEKDVTEAIDLFFQAERRNHPLALFQLGRCYESGNDVPKDELRALDYYSRAYKKGVSEAKQKLIVSATNIGDALYNEGNIDKALLVYDKAASVGDNYCKRRVIECGNKAGDIYFKECENNNSEIDLLKAIEFYNSSVKHGDLYAQTQLGLCNIKQGKIDEAYKCFKIAAQKGDASAQYYCGKCCEIGIGVEKNYIQALAWYKKAAQNGITEAKERVDYFEQNDGYKKNNNSETETHEIDPYQTLEINRQASNDEVKQAYFNKVKNLHPDFLKSKGLSEEIIKLATAELARINLAWEIIKKERGL